MGGPRGSAAETLTEKEAAMLEAIGRGENPCARVGEENTAVTGTRRRIVNGLCTKGMLTRGLVYMSRKGDARHFPEDVKGLAPELTDKGRAFIAGRRDTDPAPSGAEIEDWQAGGAL